MKIAYIGTKELKADNVAKTGLVWEPGQALEVKDVEAAKKLLEHPTIWIDTTGKSQAQIEELIPKLSLVASEPRVSFVPVEQENKHFDPIVWPIPTEIYQQIKDGKLNAIFMTSEDADAFTEWKMKAISQDTAPVKSGPKPQKAA